jgi:hypothetical protein
MPGHPLAAAVHRDFINGTPVVKRSTPKQQHHYSIVSRRTIHVKKTENQSVVD